MGRPAMARTTFLDKTATLYTGDRFARLACALGINQTPHARKYQRVCNRTSDNTYKKSGGLVQNSRTMDAVAHLWTGMGPCEYRKTSHMHGGNMLPCDGSYAGGICQCRQWAVRIQFRESHTLLSCDGKWLVLILNCVCTLVFKLTTIRLALISTPELKSSAPLLFPRYIHTGPITNEVSFLAIHFTYHAQLRVLRWSSLLDTASMDRTPFASPRASAAKVVPNFLSLLRLCSVNSKSVRMGSG